MKKDIIKKITLALLLLVALASSAVGQTAQQVLDRCAARVSNAGGVSAQFAMTSAQYGDMKGTIAIKGQKFCMKSSQSTMWFDGTTLWTYMSSNDEVNISKPTAQQLQTLSPYHFIGLYKKGYKQTMASGSDSYTVHLSATDPQLKIREAFVTVAKSDYSPRELKMLTGTKWTTFTVSGLKAEQLSDQTFRFDSSAYPDAEIIDLR